MGILSTVRGFFQSAAKETTKAPEALVLNENEFRALPPEERHKVFCTQALKGNEAFTRRAISLMDESYSTPVIDVNRSFSGAPLLEHLLAGNHPDSSSTPRKDLLNVAQIIMKRKDLDLNATNDRGTNLLCAVTERTTLSGDEQFRNFLLITMDTRWQPDAISLNSVQKSAERLGQRDLYIQASSAIKQLKKGKALYEPLAKVDFPERPNTTPGGTNSFPTHDNK